MIFLSAYIPTINMGSADISPADRRIRGSISETPFFLRISLNTEKG